MSLALNNRALIWPKFDLIRDSIQNSVQNTCKFEEVLTKTDKVKYGLFIPVNSHSLRVSLALFEIKYDLTPDFSKLANLTLILLSHS